MRLPRLVPLSGLILPIAIAVELGTGGAPGYPSAQGTPAPSPRKSVTIRTYQDDPRLQGRVRLNPRREPRDFTDQDPYAEPVWLLPCGPHEVSLLREPEVPQRVQPLAADLVRAVSVVQALEQQLGTPLRIQAEWSNQWVAWHQVEREGREHMRLLAQSFGGRWYRVKNHWVLADSSDAARLTATSAEELAGEVLRFRRQLMHSISVAQWSVLVEGGKLSFDQLSSAQKSSLRAEIRYQRYGMTAVRDIPTNDAMRGDGVFLRLTGSGVSCTLDIAIPVSNAPFRKNPPMIVSLVFADERGELIWGVPPPR